MRLAEKAGVLYSNCGYLGDGFHLGKMFAGELAILGAPEEGHPAHDIIPGDERHT